MESEQLRKGSSMTHCNFRECDGCGPRVYVILPVPSNSFLRGTIGSAGGIVI